MADTPITWDDVTALASELADVDPDAQTILLEYVNDALNPAMFKPKALRLARIYLAAHLGTNALPGDGDVVGPVTSETVGGITRAYSVIASAGTGDGFDSTVYGQTYLFIVRTSKARLPRVLR